LCRYFVTKTKCAWSKRSSDLERLSDLIEAGKVTPSIDKTYPLDQVPEAMRHLKAGKARGKVAISI
jgi:NADPH:quinone reductase-like Zn-dependent oxidoreductase